MRLTHAMVPFTALFAGYVVAACGDAVDTDNCRTYSMCPEGGSSTAGTGGNTSEAGADTGGSSSGKGGMSGGSGKGGTPNGGSSSGNGGEGGGGGVPSMPCDGACSGDTPVCKVATDTCVECTKPADCTESVETKCDTASNTCVECLATTDCTDASASKCDGGACEACTSNADCAHITGKTVCDTEAGECVQCTGTDYASCGMDMGTPLVCDSLARTCTTNKQHGADLCKPCVSDANCKLGELCVLQRYSDQDVGYFCFWKQGDTANGAPADCFTDGKPYAGTVTNATSIDGTTADICSLRSSTCTAVGQFSSKNCKPGAAPDDSLCGFASPNDAKCDQVGLSLNYRCTMTCGSNEDCPGVFPCNTSTFVCDI